MENRVLLSLDENIRNLQRKLMINNKYVYKNSLIGGSYSKKKISKKKKSIKNKKKTNKKRKNRMNRKKIKKYKKKSGLK